MDTDSFIVQIKKMIFTKILQKMLKLDFILQIMNSFLPKGKNKKVIGLMKHELGGKIMKKFVGLGAKTYSYLIDDGSEDKKAKVKKNLKF